MLFNLLQTDTLVQAAADAAEQLTATPAAQPTQMSESLFSMFTMGGPLMWVLLALSILAIYLIGRKWWVIKQASKIDGNFMNDIRDYMNAGKTKSAVTLCRKYDNPVARMIETGIHRLGRPMGDIQSAIENTGNIEVARLEKGLPILATIAGGAPMIGFLGTVLGMVKAFFNMSKAGNNIDITLLSDGIYTAMLTTVGGLIVGIIAYFGYNWLTSKVSDLVYKMESSTMEFIDIVLHEPGEE
jgi:biopolymer transport protein ExbB